MFSFRMSLLVYFFYASEILEKTFYVVDILLIESSTRKQSSRDYKNRIRLALYLWTKSQEQSKGKLLQPH